MVDRIRSTIFPERKMCFASVWERAAALIIDAFFVLLICVIASSVVSAPYVALATAWLYECLQVCSRHQATLGQRVMGIKLCHAEGGHLDFAEASLRHFCKYISFFTALSGYLLILLEPKRRCLHDRIAQAYVVTYDSFAITA